MAEKESVEIFLNTLKTKIKTFGIIFRDDRGKNMQTLSELEITPQYRKDVIASIDVSDFISGPIPDTLHYLGDMWVFGKEVKDRNVYIKIALGKINTSAICISFHIAERKLKYKFK